MNINLIFLTFTAMFKANLPSKAGVCVYILPTNANETFSVERETGRWTSSNANYYTPRQTKTPFWVGGGGAGWVDSFEP